MRKRILIHHGTPGSSMPTYRAHLEDTQHEHMADSYDDAVDGLLNYLGKIGWSGDRDEYELVDAEARPTETYKPPIYVHREDGEGSRWVAEPSGAPHLSGYGPTAEEALANCESTLKFQGFDGTFGEPIYC